MARDRPPPGGLTSEQEGLADVTETRKDGSRGRLRIDYGESREPDAALKWLWRYVDAARTAGEIYGRGLVVIAAEQYAARIVLPASQRTYRTAWGSHKDIAAKSLAKLAGPHLPASLKALERAVERAHAEHGAAIEDHAAPPPALADDDPAAATEEADEVDGEPSDGAADEAEQTGREQ